jgi:hypothetical protein
MIIPNQPYFSCIGLISFLFCKDPDIGGGGGVSGGGGFSDNKAYPNGVKFCGCFGLGCGNKMYFKGNINSFLINSCK